MHGPMKYEPPSVSKTSFNCPHCHVLCTQYWHDVTITRRFGQENRAPQILQKIDLERAKKIGRQSNEEQETNRRRTIQFIEKSLMGSPFLWHLGHRPSADRVLGNVFVSECYNCKSISVWIHDSLYYPSRGEVPAANADIPEEIRRDYDEASRILSDSPRGAAALLRLVVQKLCKELGGKGVNINDDIAFLVKNGLHPRIQKALDSVRIIGNEAVHPGQMDLRDDRETAEVLFVLINTIADNLISSEKRIDEVWGKFPENKKLQTKKRDAT